MKKTLLSVIALAAFVAMPLVNATADTSYANTAVTLNPGTETVSATADAQAADVEYKLDSVTTGLKLDADDLNGKTDVKLTLTFNAKDTNVKVDGNAQTPKEDDHTVVITDYLTANEFKTAYLNGKSYVTRVHNITFTNERGENKVQKVTLMFKADGSVKLIKKSSAENVWDTTEAGKAIASKKQITVNVKTTNALLTSAVGSDTVKFYVDTNSTLTKSVLDNHVLDYLKEKGYKVVGYYTNELQGNDGDAKLAFKDVKVEDAVTVYMYVDKGTAVVEPEKEPEATEPGSSTTKPADKDKDSTPKTGNTDLMGFVPLMTLLSLVGIVTLKKTI